MSNSDNKKKKFYIAVGGLYDIPVTKLMISVEAIQLLGHVGVVSVGDCVDFHNRVVDGIGIPHKPHGLLEAFKNEVVPQLREHGYLPDDDVT